MLTRAGIEGYITAFRWSTALFLGGAVLTALVLPSGIPAELKHAAPDTETLESELALEALPGL